MISPNKIIAASLHLEPNTAAIVRDVHRAEKLGLKQLLLNENMVQLAMDEVKRADFSLSVSGIVGYPIGQWGWSAKKVAVEELAKIQNGPACIMHAVGPWLDETPASAEEFDALASLTEEVWLLTSLAAIPAERVEKLANDIARAGTKLLILSNGVAASGLPLPDEKQIALVKKYANGRFEIAAMAPPGTPATEINNWLHAGADKVVCSDFWSLTCEEE
ncbi:hypothetical protein [Polycladidibacter stylochi]|uniref:hypothetical protein n=1 Tax=Polycladidibacter stylochi TaxID=1807766 RepID=UPI00082A6098|nr:hypothetical protein [Pseudovibrio stylochi]